MRVPSRVYVACARRQSVTRIGKVDPAMRSLSFRHIAGLSFPYPVLESVIKLEAVFTGSVRGSRREQIK
jgi:hypothetical protein